VAWYVSHKLADRGPFSLTDFDRNKCIQLLALRSTLLILVFVLDTLLLFGGINFRRFLSIMSIHLRLVD
jgi:hypothetical protein